MKRGIVLVLALALTVLAGTAVAAEEQTLTGSFVWNNENQTGKLEAVFTEKEEGKYDVAFHFTWEGDPHVYAGTAEGSLSSGKLRGRVQDDEKKNTFVFSGKMNDGQFEGQHAHISKEGKESDTGTMRLAR